MKPINRKSGFFILTLAILVGHGPLLAAGVDPQRAKPGPDGILWYDGKDLGVEGKGWTKTESFYDRLPAAANGKAPRSVWGLSHHSAGLCIRFATDAPSVQVRWTVANASLAMPHMPATGVSGVDLYARDKEGRWHFVGNGRPNAVTNTAKFGLPPGEQYLLYLPLYNGVSSVEIGIPKGKTISKVDAPRKSIVIYGTSITQGGCASRPGTAFTAIMGRRLDAEVINLGFSGSGKMEPEMADLLAELNPSVYVLDCLWNMKSEMVAERVEPFVRKLRQAHPDTPILLAEDSNCRGIYPTEKGRVLQAVFERLTKQGVKHLYLLSNQGMLGDDDEGTVDGCHPTDLGMMRCAEAFTKALRPLLKLP